jgi:hypothetical protein
MARQPEPIDRAVEEVWKQMIDPIVLRIRLDLRREREGGSSGRGERDEDDS